MEDSDYGLQDSIDTITAVVERKKKELSDLEGKLKRYRKQEKKDAVEGLMKYIHADMVSYITVLADLTGDDTSLEGLDLDGIDDVDRPDCYDRYLESQGSDVVEQELKADEIRADHCSGVLESWYEDIGEQALGSKKMIKVMLNDPYILGVIGEAIFDDDVLFDKLNKMVSGPKKSKKKSKKGKKNRGPSGCGGGFAPSVIFSRQSTDKDKYPRFGCLKTNVTGMNETGVERNPLTRHLTPSAAFPNIIDIILKRMPFQASTDSSFGIPGSILVAQRSR